VKSGLFARDLLLKHESRAEFDLFLRGFLQDFQPQGTAATDIVASLAWNRWRLRRLFQVEKAQIQEAVEFKTLDSTSEQRLEAWDESRNAEPFGGMLRNTSNPFVIRASRDILKTFRNALEIYGFEDTHPPLLQKLYGFDYDGAVPIGLYREFLAYSALAAKAPKESGDHASPDDLKKDMLEILDREIQRITILEEVALAANKRRGEYQTTAASIPDQGNLERIIRVETHLNREYGRLLNQFELVLRIRLGQPVPTIRLDISKE
jgi:hypothetical protein